MQPCQSTGDYRLVALRAGSRQHQYQVSHNNRQSDEWRQLAIIYLFKQATRKLDVGLCDRLHVIQVFTYCWLRSRREIEIAIENVFLEEISVVLWRRS
jgi:hypothetical protein